jgi:hypothetical protein
MAQKRIITSTIHHALFLTAPDFLEGVEFGLSVFIHMYTYK